MTKIDSIESKMPLRDSDSRITFKSDGTLLEYDSGIERIYQWRILKNSQIEIFKIENDDPEPYRSFLRLEQIVKIDQLDSVNLILIALGENGTQYRYHYREH